MLLAAAVSITACGAIGAADPAVTPDATAAPTPRLIIEAATVVAPATPTAESTPVVAAVIEPADTPLPAATAIPEPTVEPSPTRISEVLPAASAPEPVIVRGGSSPALPPNIGVSMTGCASDGQCLWYNFYWAPTRQIVLQPGEGQNKVWHEYGHAHQHWSINGGEPLRPSDYDLESWYETKEGINFTAAVARLPWPWTHSAESGLEDFAWTFGYWYYDPAYLLSVSPERYDWAAANLP